MQLGKAFKTLAAISAVCVLWFAGCSQKEENVYDNGNYSVGNGGNYYSGQMSLSVSLRDGENTQTILKNGTLEFNKDGRFGVNYVDKYIINMEWDDAWKGKDFYVSAVGNFPQAILDAYQSGGAKTQVTLLVQSAQSYSVTGATPLADTYPSMRGRRDAEEGDLAKLETAFMVAFTALAQANGHENPIESIMVKWHSLPNQAPTVNGGELTKGGDGENRTVNSNNLEEFLQAFYAAYYYDGYQSGKAPSEIRGKRELLEEYEKYAENWTYEYTVIGAEDGRAEVKQIEIEDYSWSGNYGNEIDYETGEYKFFDFSNTGDLYLGGAIGIFYKWEMKDRVATETDEINGSISFQGKFKGRIVFERAKAVYKLKRVFSEYGGWEYEVMDSITSGKFYVESNGLKINIDYNYWLETLDFDYPRGKKHDYGEQIITITMPNVPSAPNGTLNTRGGTTVNEGNANMFFEAFVEELYYDSEYKYPRGAEGKGFGEELEYGKVSGYLKEKGESNVQGAFESSIGGHYSGTETIEYVDYSNKGRLYFGGGWAKAGKGVYKTTINPNPFTITNKDTIIINGKVKFNGEFKGELDFQNFKFALESYYDEIILNQEFKYNHMSGRIAIGSLDVTDLYIEEVLKRN